ncbi:hypothetical protein ACFLU9_02045 [Chloroflexota bacterium]
MVKPVKYFSQEEQLNMFVKHSLSAINIRTKKSAPGYTHLSMRSKFLQIVSTNSAVPTIEQDYTPQKMGGQHNTQLLRKGEKYRKNIEKT